MVSRPLRSLAATVAVAGLGLASLSAASAESIRVGVSAGPHAEIMDVVSEIAAERDLEIEVVEFTDYLVPNEAVASGEIDANSFQHLPYLENQIENRGYDLAHVADTVIFPMGFYSEKVESLDDLPEGGTIAIQNDPTNGGRALLLLETGGVLELREDVGLLPSVADITANPKNLRIIELDAAQLPRSLQDVDAAAVNTNYAVEAGLDPQEDAILREGPDSPYVNIIVVHGERKDEPWVETLIESYHTQEVKDFIQERFGNALVISW